MLDLLIRNCRIVNGGVEPFTGSVAVRSEKIVGILEPQPELSAHMEIDGEGKVLFPGLIDPHVHYHYSYNYRDSSREYDTETYSALLGGVTTAIRMHRGQGPFEEHLPSEIEMLKAQSRIDMTLHLTLMTEEQLATFPAFCDRYGLNSFKLYLAYKGRAGQLQGILGADDGFLYDAMRRIGCYPGGIACVHAENSEISERLVDQLKAEGRDDLRAWAAARPGWTEAEAVSRAGTIAHHANCPLYIVHLSSADGADAIRQLRGRGMQVYAEVCVQHLTDTADTPLGPVAKVNPPLRSQEDVAALWEAVSEGVIDTIGTDHVAHTRARAELPVWDIMPGNPGTATMLPALLTFGYHKGRLSLSHVASLLAKNASRIFHLPNKGEIVVGADADLVLVDLNLERQVTAEWLHSSSDYSLYQGMTLKGWPTLVTLRGQVVMKDNRILAQPGSGKFIPRRWVESGS